MANVDIRDAFFGEIYKLAKKDKDLIFISDDMDAFMVRKLKKEMPKQFINIGVSEQNMMDVAAGLATLGKKVFVYGICSYVTARAFEQIRFSICSMKLPVTIIGVGAGFSFPFDGPTHHGVTDIGIMSTLPEMEIYNPSTSYCAQMVANLSYRSTFPCYIRLDKGFFEELYEKNDDFYKGFKIVLKNNDKVIISTGYMTDIVNRIINTQKKQTGLVDMFRIKPLGNEIVSEVLKKIEKVLVIEENSELGGLGAILEDLILENNLKLDFKKISLDDVQEFSYGSREFLQKKHFNIEKSISLF